MDRTVDVELEVAIRRIDGWIVRQVRRLVDRARRVKRATPHAESGSASTR